MESKAKQEYLDKIKSTIKSEFNNEKFKELVVNFDPPNNFTCIICEELLYEPKEC